MYCPVMKRCERMWAVPDAVGEDAAGAVNPPVQHVRRLAQVHLPGRNDSLRIDQLESIL